MRLFSGKGMSGKSKVFKSVIARVKKMAIPVRVKGMADKHREPRLMTKMPSNIANINDNQRMGIMPLAYNTKDRPYLENWPLDTLKMLE